MIALTDTQWDQLVDAIRKEKAIFFLGPNATINYAAHDRQSQFYTQLAQDNPDNGIVAYHSEDGFLVFEDNDCKGQIYGPLRKFYQQTFPNPLLDQLATIPLHVAITVTPDLALNQAFERQQFAFTHQYYDAKSPRKIDHIPTTDLPLIYNLLGCVKQDESIITSHFDLFETMQSMCAYQFLPQEITTLLSGGLIRNIVFLGFEFDKWYCQFVLFLLKIRGNPKGRFAAASTGLDEIQKLLLQAQFKISFVGDDMEAFVQTLHSKFDPEELRKIDATNENDRNYHLPNVIRLLTEAFSTMEFEAMCLANFMEVYREFPSSMAQGLRIQLLIDHCERHGKIAQLLALIHEHNAHQFHLCGPYHD